jgi:hypothetical protein
MIMNQFVNEPAVNWARQTLPQTVEVKIKEHKILLGIAMGLLILIFGGIALAIYASAILSLMSKGWSSQVTGGLIGGTFFLVVLIVFVGGLFLLGKFTRKHFAKFLDGEGVRTRGGKSFRWADLHYLDYKKMNVRINPHQLAASATQAAIMAGVEKVTVNMVFAGGKAVIPPLIIDQPQILGLLNSIPVQRRENGTVKQ